MCYGGNCSLVDMSGYHVQQASLTTMHLILAPKRLLQIHCSHDTRTTPVGRSQFYSPSRVISHVHLFQTRQLASITQLCSLFSFVDKGELEITCW